MRLMLGYSKDHPSLLVEVNAPYDPNCFDFWVINGAWNGRFINNEVYVEKDTTLSGVFILCSDQKLLYNADHYNDIFEQFDRWVHGEKIEYVTKESKAAQQFEDDDIPF